MSNFFTIEGNKKKDLEEAKLPTRGSCEFALTEDGQVIVIDMCGNYTYTEATYPSVVPPISKEEFVGYIMAIKELDEGIDKINAVMDEVCQDNIYCPPTLKEDFLKLLVKLFHDEKTDWIFYFIYDLNFGRDWTESSVTENGHPVPLRTPEDLYDLLVSNIKREYKE